MSLATRPDADEGAPVFLYVPEKLLDGRTGQDSDGHDWQNTFGDMGC